MAKRADNSNSSEAHDKSPLGQQQWQLHSILNQFTFGTTDSGVGKREREGGVGGLRRGLTALWKMHTCYGHSIIDTITERVASGHSKWAKWQITLL